MARYVDIDKYNEFLSTCGDRDYPCVNSCTECYFKCNNDEIGEVAPVVHAKWEELADGGYLDPRMICSNCGNISTPLVSWMYCPYCNAKMDKE